MPNDNELLKETYRLAKENNKMLHAMRRNAFLGGLFKILLYAAFIVIPYVLYMQFVAPVLQQLQTQVQQIQGVSTSAQNQFGQLGKTLDDLKAKIPGLPSTTSH